jgi:hypothetical protein
MVSYFYDSIKFLMLESFFFLIPRKFNLYYVLKNVLRMRIRKKILNLKYIIGFSTAQKLSKLKKSMLSGNFVYEVMIVVFFKSAHFLSKGQSERLSNNL